MNQLFKFAILSIFSAFILGSCSPKIIGELPIKKEKLKTEILVMKLDSISKQVPSTFYTKISTKYKDTTQNLSFKTSITLLKDSVLSAIVSYAGIPLINAKITNDSLCFTNKREKCYVNTTIESLKSQFGVEFAFKNLQELLLGIPLNYKIDGKYFQLHNQNFHVISNHKKREIKKLERKDLDDFIIKYYFTDNLNNLYKVLIENPKDNTEIEVTYSKYQTENGFSIPEEVYIQVKTDKNRIETSLEYEKVEINEPQDVFFTIPENYEICK
jgi:hypothetical protein